MEGHARFSLQLLLLIRREDIECYQWLYQASRGNGLAGRTYHLAGHAQCRFRRGRSELAVCASGSTSRACGRSRAWTTRTGFRGL